MPSVRVQSDAGSLLVRLQGLARKKFLQDFHHSVLDSPHKIKVDRQRTTQILEVAKLLRPNRLFDLESGSITRTMCYHGVCPSDSLALLREHGRIHISTESIAVAPIAVARSLAQRSPIKLDLTVTFEEVNGRDHIYALGEEHSSPDFFIAPDGAFHLNPSKTLNNYRLITPCFYEDQYLIGRSRFVAREGGTIFYFPTSSAETMLTYVNKMRSAPMDSSVGWRLLRTLKTIGDLVAHARLFKIEAYDIPKYAKSLDGSDVIVAWEPLASGLIESIGKDALNIVPRSWFPVVFSLNAHERWTHSSRSKLLAAFIDVFVAEWCFCQRHPEYAWGLIEQDLDFLCRLGMGAGIDVSGLINVTRIVRDPPSSGREPAVPPRPAEDDSPQYVTLSQLATFVKRHKKTLERALVRSHNSMPPPEVTGGGGKKAEWDYSKVRGWLVDEFGKLLPLRFPGGDGH